MKWRYAITYGKMKPGWTFEGIEKEMAKYKADVEKAGLKLVFWGHPYGVSENIIAVFDVGGDMDKYLKTVGSLSAPYTDSRTNFVMEH